MEKRLTGAVGERLVREKYIQNGYKILTLNYRLRIGEIDIIAQKGNVLVFIEVKTRKDDKFASARQAVTYSKQSKIKATAAEYMSSHGMDNLFARFDVAEVYDPLGKAVINIIENAFE